MGRRALADHQLRPVQEENINYSLTLIFFEVPNISIFDQHFHCIVMISHHDLPHTHKKLTKRNAAGAMVLRPVKEILQNVKI